METPVSDSDRTRAYGNTSLHHGWTSIGNIKKRKRKEKKKSGPMSDRWQIMTLCSTKTENKEPKTGVSVWNLGLSKMTGKRFGVSVQIDL